MGDPIRANELFLTSVNWSPDGSRIVTSGIDGTARIYDAGTRQQIGTSLGLQLPAMSLLPYGGNFPYAEFSPHGRWIVVADPSGQAWIWPATTAGWRAYACQVAGRELTSAEWSTFLPDRPEQPICS
jgi:WD40 repeat protein